jgi:hypothetical protein
MAIRVRPQGIPEWRDGVFDRWMLAWGLSLINGNLKARRRWRSNRG